MEHSKYRIPSPCHCKWNEFTGDEKKRFCEECQTPVYNISLMNDSEIKEVLKKNGKICGMLSQKKRLASEDDLPGLDDEMIGKIHDPDFHDDLDEHEEVEKIGEMLAPDEEIPEEPFIEENSGQDDHDLEDDIPNEEPLEELGVVVEISEEKE